MNSNKKIENIIKELNSEKNLLNVKFIAKMLMLNNYFDINLNNYELSKILDISENKVNNLFLMECSINDYKKIIYKAENILNNFSINNRLINLAEIKEKLEQIKLIIGNKNFNKSILLKLKQRIENISDTNYCLIRNILDNFYYCYLIPSYDNVQKIINLKKKYKKIIITFDEYNQFIFDSNCYDNNLYLKNIFIILRDIFKEYRDDFVKNHDAVKFINDKLKSELESLM